MSVLKVGGVSLAHRYKTLQEAVNASQLGDTIQIYKKHLRIDQTIVVDHDLYIEGVNRPDIEVPDHLAAIVVKNANLHMSGFISQVGQANLIVSAPDSTTGSIELTDILARHTKRLSAREYFPLISCQGTDDSGVNVKLHRCLFANVTISAPEVTIDDNSEIGRVLSATSFIRAPRLYLHDCTLNNVKLVNPTPQDLHLRNIETTGNLDLYGNFILDGLNVAGVELLKPKKDIKKLQARADTFNQSPQQYAVLVHANSDQPARFTLQNFKADTTKLIQQKDALQLAWFALDNVDTNFVKTNVPSSTGLTNYAKGGSITLDQCHDNSKWQTENTVVSNRNSQVPGLRTTKQNKQDDALAQLQAMIGLQPVKQKINELISTADVTLRLQKNGQNAQLPPMHMVFGGNAGTGKTTVARLVAKALYQHGVLKTNKFKEATAKDLVSQNVGGTTEKTHQLVESALDGVLFIDEAYSLAPSGGQNDFNSEAVNQLIADMENYRDRIVVIMAGYTDKMKQFFQVGNPGLQSRFRNWIDFPDYNVGELQAIAQLEITKQNLRFATPQVQQQLNTGINQLVPTLDKNSGNGRFIRNLIDDIIDIKNARVTHQNTMDEAHLLTIESSDVANGLQRIGQQITQMTGKASTPQASKQQGDALKTLDNMIGLDNVKTSLRQLIALAKVNQVAQANGQPGNTVTMHAIFAGNAGTGKTTVARLYARALYQNGVLKTDNVQECTAKDLVAGFVGQTADKTAKVVEKALDGVLFIDEAYQLASTPGGNDFNHEAVDELIAQMENHRKNLVVIMAGYTDDMKAFLQNGNAGLASRFRNWIEFPDYTPKQLDQILIYMLKKQHLLLDSRNTLNILVQGISQLAQTQSKNAGNARFVRNLVDAIVTAKALRIAPQVEQMSNQQRNTVISSDASQAIAQMMNHQKTFG